MWTQMCCCSDVLLQKCFHPSSPAKPISSIHFCPRKIKIKETEAQGQRTALLMGKVFPTFPWISPCSRTLLSSNGAKWGRLLRVDDQSPWRSDIFFLSLYKWDEHPYLRDCINNNVFGMFKFRLTLWCLWCSRADQDVVRWFLWHTCTLFPLAGVSCTWSLGKGGGADALFQSEGVVLEASILSFGGAFTCSVGPIVAHLVLFSQNGPPMCLFGLVFNRGQFADTAGWLSLLQNVWADSSTDWQNRRISSSKQTQILKKKLLLRFEGQLYCRLFPGVIFHPQMQIKSQDVPEPATRTCSNTAGMQRDPF